MDPTINQGIQPIFDDQAPWMKTKSKDMNQKRYQELMMLQQSFRYTRKKPTISKLIIQVLSQWLTNPAK